MKKKKSETHVLTRIYFNGSITAIMGKKVEMPISYSEKSPYDIYNNPHIPSSSKPIKRNLRRKGGYPKFKERE